MEREAKDSFVHPDFLIIGAMKAGTTTLYRDLARHPDIFLPAEKEPDILVRHEDIDAMRADYASLFRAALPGQLKGEASTAYTKRPTHEGVAEAALRLCGPGLKLIYITREPVARMISQYEHERQYGLVEGDFASALDRRPELIAYSRYDWQLEPWIATFGEANLLRLTLESYSRDRRPLLGQVLRFVGLDPARLPEIDTGAAANRRDEAKTFIEGSLLGRVVVSNLYQRRIKPMIPARWRERARTAILPAPDTQEIVIDDDLRASILGRLERS